MKPFREISIREKLIRMNLLVAAAVLLLASLAFVVYEWVTFRDTMVRGLSTQAEIIGINTAAALLFNDPGSATETVATLRIRPTIRSAAVYTAEGRLFAKYLRDAKAFQLPERFTERMEGNRFEAGSLFLSRPILTNGERVGTVFIESDLREMEVRLKRYAMIVAGVFVLSMTAAYGVSSRLQGMISNPLLHLAQTAKTVSEEKNYSVRAVTENRDEIGQLVQTFNEMLAQIQERDDALRKASDELEQRVTERTKELEQEIGERKQAEEELRRAEAFLNSIVENIPNMLFVKEARDLRFVRFNKAGEALLGYSRGELIGKNDSDFFPKEQADAFIAKDRQVLRAGYLVDIPEEPIQSRDRGTRILHTQKIPLYDPEGRPLYLLGISEDITERKQAEEEMKKLNAQLEGANKELEAFSYSVSHDLRAPLRHINGFVELLKEHYGAQLDEKGQRYLNTIVNSSKKMGSLIDDLLVFSRMAKTEMRIASVNFDFIVREVMSDLQPDLEGREIVWTVGPLPEVEGDATMLRQVWANLIGNAVKYTRTRERAAIEIGSRSEEKETVFFVRDNGVGFDPQYGGKLFGVFQRLHRSDEFEGTGIGLANVRRIIYRHGGRTWAESQLDQGAVFYFSLPKREEGEKG
ncbi:MAG: PAS domain S-box protein [Candidatus Manganitrophaceae bacterium]|nr:MAG: PAS domain S-box protein [Candidatus Manganitrophaceae bacterium]